MHPSLLYVATAIVILAGGCAQQIARKVPLDARLSGQDDGIEGFRYYTSRPYIVVTRRVDVRTDTQLARLCRVRIGQNPEYALRPVIPADGSLLQADESAAILPSLVMPIDALYDLRGNAWPEAEFCGYLTADDVGSRNQVVARLARYQQHFPPGVFGGDPGTTADATSQEEPPPPPIQIAFLPDFEEQMTIHNRNCLAHSKFELHFRDGWQLSSTKGSWDSTEVAVRALQSISNAIGAVATVQQTALEKLPLPTPPADKTLMETITDDDKANLVVVSRRWFIEPGIYRLQKSWERCDPEAGICNGDGLLTDLGISMVSEVQLELVQ